jgi:hypothetical protein
MEVVKMAKDQDDAVLSPSESAQLAELNAFFPGITDVTPGAVRERMAGRMRSASSLDDLFDALDGQNSKSNVGKTFEFLGVSWQPYTAKRSNGEDEIIPLAVCEVVDVQTGEEGEFVSTGEMVVEFLRQAQFLNVFPFKARIESKLTRSGQTALNLVRA